MKNMNLSKLKSGTDIRGVAVEGEKGQSVELTNEAVDLIARAFYCWLDIKNPVLAVGRDCRISGERISGAVMDALCDMGAKVLDFSLCTTPAMFMSTVLLNCDAAISVTASHHPYNRNGLKFFTKQGGLDGKNISEILALCDNIKKGDSKGSIEKIDFLSQYAAYLRDMICSALDKGERPLQGLKISCDAGNGAGGFYASDVLAPLGADVSGSINLTPDGMFPNHIPNPENEYAMSCACKMTTDSSADLGIIFDTDVDRAGAVGPDGTEINRNRLVALASVLALEDCKGGVIVTDSVTSSGLKTFIEENLGGEHYRFKRGYKNVIDEAIRLENEDGKVCPLAIETSGHAAFKKNYFLDDGAYLITRIIIKLAQLKSEGKSIGDLVKDLKEPEERKEIRLNILEPDFKACGEKVIENLKEFVKSSDNLTEADDNREGVRVYTDYGWFLLRLSVHDPVMPLNFESDIKGKNEEMINLVYSFFKTQEGIDLSPFNKGE